MPVYRPAEYVLQSVNYVAANGRSLPAILLYEAGGLGYCQFATEAWGHYDGFGYYSTAAIHLEHLRSADGKPLGTREESRKIREPLCGMQPTGTPKKPQAPLPAKSRCHHDNSRPVAKAPTAAKNGSTPPVNSPERELSKLRINGEEHRSLRPVRSIAGLALADFLYDR
jgi:hypothetical protein